MRSDESPTVTPKSPTATDTQKSNYSHPNSQEKLIDTVAVVPGASCEIAPTTVDETRFDDEEIHNTRGSVEPRRQSLLDRHELLILGLVTATGAVLRSYRLSEPSAIVFDETHFLRFALLYLRGQFFFDIHPPLGKLIFAVVGQASGLLVAVESSGQTMPFDKIGTPFSSGVDYVPLRAVSVVAGTLLVPLSWATVRRLGHGPSAACMCAVMVCFDNALVTISRVIMLDSILLLFILAAVCFALCVRDDEANEFSVSYFVALAATGLSLGCAVSVKMVGLGAFGVVGLETLARLWSLWGQHHRSVWRFWLHVLSRFCFLFCLPLCIYIGLFIIHLRWVPLSGPGDGFVSRRFQQTITGNGFALSFASNVYKGQLHAHSTVTIRRMYGDECWLTISNISAATPPLVRCIQGAQGTQESSSGLWWEFVGPPRKLHESSAHVGLEHMSVVLLRHVSTGSLLHAIDSSEDDTRVLSVISPSPKAQWQNTSRLSRALWRIEILGQEDAILRTPSSLVRLSHAASNMALQCTNQASLVSESDVKLKTFPCVLGANLHDTSGGWHFDRAQTQNEDPNADMSETDGRESLSPLPMMSTSEKIIELHSVIFRRNNELSGNHQFGSRPLEWPLLHRGIAFWRGTTSQGCTSQVYLVGNLAIWWMSTASLLVFVAIDLIYRIRMKRGIYDISQSTMSRFSGSGEFLVTAWLIHFLPFFFFSRLLFLHHYLPALMFSIIVAAILLEHACVQFLPSPVASQMLPLFVSVIIACYVPLSPFIYATEVCSDELSRIKWISSWDFHVVAQ